MSIYNKLFDVSIKLFGNDDSRHITILSVPPHIVTVGPSWDFLPAPVEPEGRVYRAVIVVELGQLQGTARSVHEFPKPLLILTGQEYHDIRFVELMYRIEEALDAAYGQPEWKRVVGREDGRWYID
jgi:hypothetical protein